SPGTFNFTLHLADGGAQTADKPLSIVVSPATLSITTTSFAGGAVGNAYSQTAAATGGTLPYVWSLAPGPLPPGLVLNANTGAITGTPTSPGTFNFTLHLADGGAQTADKPLSIVVSPATLSITTTSFAGGAVGNAYSQTAAATGGTLPYTWSLAPGPLPPGLGLNANTGAITGTPTSPGTFNFTLHLADGGAQTADKPLSIV